MFLLFLDIDTTISFISYNVALITVTKHSPKTTKHYMNGISSTDDKPHPSHFTTWDTFSLLFVSQAAPITLELNMHLYCFTVQYVECSLYIAF